ncbi:MAG: G8 domain-containing protein, partial [Acidobacteriota bacterium]
MKKVFCAAVLSLLVSTLSTADTHTSRQSGDWGSIYTWQGYTVPSSTDLVVIASGHTVSTTTGRTCAGLTITGTLSFSDYQTITVNGPVSGAGTI